jgi:hypothetical protein
VDRRNSILVAACGVGAAIALVVIALSGPSATAMQSAAAELDGRIRETAAAVQARAQTLAQLPRMSWAVATDEQTMLDLTADELAFQPAAGELIEIGQVQRRDGGVTTLRRVGDGALVHLPLGEAGTRLIAADGRLSVVAVVDVEAKTRADQIRGAIGVARLVDTAALAARVAPDGFALRVDAPGGGGAILGNAPADARTHPLSFYADAAHGARLTALVAAGASASLLVVAVLILGASLAVAVWLWRRAATVAADAAPLSALVPEGDPSGRHGAPTTRA